MDTLTQEFVELVQGEIDTGTMSHFTRLSLMCGPPEGVDFESVEVIGVMHDAAMVFNVTGADIHADWLELWKTL